MDYLELLPPNVHEDIIKRVVVEKPFDTVHFFDRLTCININFYRSEKTPKGIKTELRKLEANPYIAGRICVSVVQCLYKKDTGVYILKTDTSSSVINTRILFIGNNRLYFNNRSPICLTEEVNNQLLEKFKEWSKCSKCIQNGSKSSKKYEDTYIEISKTCRICNTKLEPRHIQCYLTCSSRSMFHYGSNNQLCDNCSVNCGLCFKTYCQSDIYFCESCDTHICKNHMKFCFICVDYQCKEHHLVCLKN